MKTGVQPEKIDLKTLVVFFIFFHFFPLFLGQEYLSNILPFSEFTDVLLSTTTGNLVFLVLLLYMFKSTIAVYFVSPNLRMSLHYGVSLKVVALGIMVPIGYFSLKVNQDYFYNYWWEYIDVPVFYFSKTLFSTAFDKERFIYFICTVTVTPIFEEILYRLVFVNVLRRKYPLSKSVVIAAVIFGLVHPTYFFFAFIGSLVLSFLIFKTRSVWSAIIAHGIYNSLVFLDEYYFGIERFKPLESIYSFETWSVHLLFLPAALVITYIFFKKNRAEIKAFRSLPKSAGGG